MKKILALLISLLLLPACPSTPRNEVVVYTALDQVFSEPILKDFEKATGIKVKMLTDTEASKTVGLVQRLLAEKDHPQADVFWNNEIGWTLVLKEQGILSPYQPDSARDIPAQYKDPDNYWTGFAARVRVILYNTNLLKEEPPQSVSDLTKPTYKGRVVIARPLFGTTATHVATLFAVLGEDQARKFFMDIKNNDCQIAAGNMMAAKMVAEGEIAICLTDTDDANGMMLKNKPVKMVYPDQDGLGALVLPNTIALIKGGPNPANGKKLIEYVLQRQTEQQLARFPSAQLPLRPGIAPYSPQFDLSRIKSMEVDFAKVARWLGPAKEFIQNEFLK